MAVDASGQALKWSGSSWSKPVQIIPRPAQNDPLHVGISCVSSSFCMAVDSTGRAVRFNGSSWTAPLLVGGSAHGHSFVSVSCPTTAFCMAVGMQWANRYDNGAWRAPVQILKDAVYAGDVSCVSRLLCVAAAQEGSGRSDALRYNGTSWSAPSVLFGAGQGVAHLSCPASKSCMAVDEYAHYRRWNGTSWSASASMGINNLQYLSTVRVTCHGPTFCIAAGDENIGNWPTGRAVRWNGSTWTSLSGLAPSVTDLSCVATNFCIAVDRLGRYERFDGSHWSRNGFDLTAGGQDAVSCPTVTFCMAVDYRGAVTHFNGSMWSGPTRVVNTFESSLTDVSCTSSTFCIAVSSGGAVYKYNGKGWAQSGIFDGGMSAVSCVSTTYCLVTGGNLVSRFNGSSWSAPKRIWTDEPGPSSISCISGKFCMVSDSVGHVFTFDGTQWHSATIDAKHRALTLSCASTTLCAAVASEGFSQVATWNGKSWSAFVEVAGLGRLQAVSCRQHSCVLTDSTADEGFFNDGVWTYGQQGPTAGSGLHTLDLSCISMTWCAFAANERAAVSQ